MSNQKYTYQEAVALLISGKKVNRAKLAGTGWFLDFDNGPYWSRIANGGKVHESSEIDLEDRLAEDWEIVE